MERILEGSFKQTGRTLLFPEKEILFEVISGERYEGSFLIRESRDMPVEGEVFVRSLRMSLPESRFSGSESGIVFFFDAAGLLPYEKVEGEFLILSDCGEYRLPYRANVLPESKALPEGVPSDMLSFLSLAREDFDEAASFFKEEELFSKMLEAEEKKSLDLYRLLVKGKNAAQCLEEFLKKTGKKRPVRFLIENPYVEIDIATASAIRHLTVSRSTWGYTDLAVTTDAPFIRLSKENLTDEDFRGNKARFAYSVLEEKLHSGKNFAKITFRSLYGEVSAAICVIRHPVNRRIRDLQLGNDHLMLDLMRYYVAFRTRRIAKLTWLNESERLLGELRERDPESLAYRLMYVHILITKERFHEAGWLLEQDRHTAESGVSDRLYAYYRYLRTFVFPDERETEEAYEVIRAIYEKNPSDWRVAWIFGFLSDELTNAPEKKWEFLKDLSDRGNSSPVIYTEAAQLVLSNPTLITVLEPFEIRLLRFMSRNGLLSDAVADQFLYLSTRLKSGAKRLLPLLYDCAKKTDREDALSALCSVLISEDQRDDKAFEVYERAVERGLRITRLYEYYLLSADPDRAPEIPQRVLLYFAYDLHPDPSREAFLYAYVMKNRDRYPAIMEKYRDPILRFVLASAEDGRNDRNLAYLYRSILTEVSLTPEVAKGLSRALFIRRIRPKHPGITGVRVRYPNLIPEFDYEGSGEEISIPVYGEAVIALSDGEGHLFADDEAFEERSLTGQENLAGMLIPYLEGDLLFDTRLTGLNRELLPVSEETKAACLRLTRSKEVERSAVLKINMMLARYFYEQDRTGELDAFLEGIGPEDVEAGDIPELIRLLVLRNRNTQAYRVLTAAKKEDPDPKILFRLLERLLKERVPDNPLGDGSHEDPGSDETFLALVYRSFLNGRYDGEMLRYLLRYFRGTPSETLTILEAARKEGLKPVRLAENLLKEVLITGEETGKYAAVFSFYAETGDDRNLILAFITKACFDYFVEEKPLGDVFVKELPGLSALREIPLVCKLAYTKHCSERVSKLSEEETKQVFLWLREIVGRGLCFSWFRAYTGTYTFMHRFLDKTILEYRSEPGHHVSVNFLYESGGDGEEGYEKEPMRDMFHGIFVRQFVLFYGDVVRYYITDTDSEGNEKQTSGVLGADAAGKERDRNSKYGLLNEIALSRTMNDKEELEKLLLRYYQLDYFRKTL
ncbi:MAG: DUF5717 family protein [Lachnospiraceae bacterium]|nr:DUF5717 family protein [Lachnospiraceae bacterium]